LEKDQRKELKSEGEVERRLEESEDERREVKEGASAVWSHDESDGGGSRVQS